MSLVIPTNADPIQSTMREAYDLMREANHKDFITITASFHGHPDTNPQVRYDAAFVLDDGTQPRGYGASAMEAARGAVEAMRTNDPLTEARKKLEAAGYAVAAPDPL